MCSDIIHLVSPGTTRRRKRNVIDVREIREAQGLSRAEFAIKYGLSIRTIESWEQKRRPPDGTSAVLLLVIAHAPDVVAEALESLRPQRLR